MVTAGPPKVAILVVASDVSGEAGASIWASGTGAASFAGCGAFEIAASFTSVGAAGASAGVGAASTGAGAAPVVCGADTSGFAGSSGFAASSGFNAAICSPSAGAVATG